MSWTRRLGAMPRLFLFAWFTATAGNVQKGADAVTGNVSAANNSETMGNVSVNVVWGELPTGIVLTDNQGKSYYYRGQVGDAFKKEVTVAEGAAAKALGYTISITGTDDDKIAAAGTYDVTFTAGGIAKIANSAESAIAVNASGSTCVVSFVIGNNGAIASGATGSIYIGLMGADSDQSVENNTGTVAFTSVTAHSN